MSSNIDQNPENGPATNVPPAGDQGNNPTNPMISGAINPNNQVLDWIDNEDLNGECFISGEVGEVETKQDQRIVGFVRGMPYATTPNSAVAYTSAQTSAFLLLNVKLLANAKNQTPSVEHLQIAYLRYLAVRSGLISPAFSTDEHHVKYNEAVLFTDASLARAVGNVTDASVSTLTITAGARRTLRENFANIVCCIAYMFRVRGHHYLTEMEGKYKALWKKCLKDGDTPGLDWSLIAHEALHAIMPDVLDNFWTVCKDGGRIAGALIKRYDSAPAGVAAVRAVYAGAQDLQMAVPGIRDRFKQHFDDLDDLINQMRVKRWAGSINRRYYNADAIDFDEQKFGAIASVVYHALAAFAANSQLLKSNALIRVANNAPITGGIVSRSIATAAADPALVKSMLNITRD